MQIKRLLVAALTVTIWLSNALPAYASMIVESLKRNVIYAYENADKEADKARALEQTLPADSPQLIDSYQRAATLCLIAGKIPEAKEWEMKVIRALERENPQNFGALAQAYETMGFIWQAKLPPGMEPKNWQPLEVPAQVTDAFLRRQMEYYAPFAQRIRDADAEMILWKAKSVQALELAGAESSLKHAYDSIALSSRVKGDYEASLTWLFKLQPLREKEQEYVMLYEDIAKIYIVQGNFAAAESWLHKSLQSAEKTAPHRRASLYQELSKCAMLKGDYAEALGCLQQTISLRAQEKQAAEAKRQYALNQQYSQMGVKKRAQMKAADEAKAAALQKPEDQRSNRYAKMTEQRDLGRIYHAMENQPQAIACQEAALTLAKQLFKDAAGDLGRYYYELGLSYRDGGDQAAAKRTLRTAAELMLRAQEKRQDSQYADWLSKIYIAQGDYDQALEWKLREGVSVTTAPDSLRAVNYYRALSELYALRGDGEKSAFWQSNATAVQKLYTADAKKVAVIYPMGYDM